MSLPRVKKNNGYADVLYVHPYTGMLDYSIIPTGAIALMNRINHDKKGMFSFEVKERDLKGAKIIALDLHWFYSLYHVSKLCSEYKRINPLAKIILGGYTATVLADVVIKKMACDYIIKGDADYSFPRLVDGLLNGNSIKEIPNLVSKEFATPFSYSLTADEFNSCDYLNVDWFLSLIAIRRRYPLFGSFVFIQALKGCFNQCNNCYGNDRLQGSISNRGLIVRNAKCLVDEMIAYSQDKSIEDVFMTSDFINIYNDAEFEIIFSHYYDFILHYQFFNYYDRKEIYSRLSKSFRKVRINLPVYYYQGCLKKNIPLPRLQNFLETLALFDNINVTLLIDKELNNNELFCLRKTIRNLPNVYFRYDNNIIIDVPMPKDNFIELENEYNRYFRISRKKYFSFFNNLLSFAFFRIIKKSKTFFLTLLHIYYRLQKNMIFSEFTGKVYLWLDR